MTVISAPWALRWNEEMFATPERFLNEHLEVEHCCNSWSPATVYRKQYIEEMGGYRKELGHWADTFMLRAIGLKYRRRLYTGSPHHGAPPASGIFRIAGPQFPADA